MMKNYRPAEAAKALGVSTPTLWRWLASKELPAVKLSPGVTIITEEALEAFIARKAGARNSKDSPVTHQ